MVTAQQETDLQILLTKKHGILFNIFTFHFAVILRFRSQYGRLPQSFMTTTEKEHLLKLRDEVMKELNLDVTLLSDEFAR